MVREVISGMARCVPRQRRHIVTRFRLVERRDLRAAVGIERLGDRLVEGQRLRNCLRGRPARATKEAHGEGE
jgi:hypothetical protein